jgi:hypothetical protein
VTAEPGFVPGLGPETAARTAAWALRRLAEQDVQGQAVLHPLGFVCFPLLRGRGTDVCVHVWLSHRAEFAPELTTSAIHSHSWDLQSLVLSGHIGNELIDVRPSSEAEATHRVYEVRSAQGADEVTPTALCVRTLLRDVRYTRAGDVYTLPGGEFHSSVVPDGLDAATVLLASSRGGTDRALGSVDPGHGAVRLPRRPAPEPLGKLAAQLVLDLPPVFPRPPC